MFAILALVGWFPDPSWLILRGFGWQIKPGICQKSVKMGTRFGAHFMVLFFVQGVDYQASQVGPRVPSHGPDNTDHNTPSRTDDRKTFLRQTSNIN